MVMMILALFGITIYTLIAAGADTQKRIMNQKDAQADARVALSYINVRLRQNDAEGRIGVERIDLTGENAIVLRERSKFRDSDTWIYCYEGRIYECMVDPGEQPSDLFSFYVVDADYLDTTFDSVTGRVTNTVYYSYDGEWQNLSSSVYLRSH
jgi:hypothetical protein